MCMYMSICEGHTSNRTEHACNSVQLDQGFYTSKVHVLYNIKVSLHIMSTS